MSSISLFVKCVVTASLLCPSLCWAGASRNFRGGNNDDLIDYGSAANIDSFTTLTHAAWVFIDAFPTENTLRVQGKGTHSVNVSTGDSNCSGPAGTATCIFFFADTTGSDGEWYGDDNGVATGAWYFLFSTYDTSAPTTAPSLYVNCVQQTLIEQGGVSGTLNSDAGGFYRVGNNASPGVRELDGQEAYVHYYNSQLSAQSCFELMYRPGSIPIGSNGLFAYQLGSNSPEIDVSGNGNTGTVTGATESFIGPPVMIGDAPI